MFSSSWSARGSDWIQGVYWRLLIGSLEGLVTLNRLFRGQSQVFSGMNLSTTTMTDSELPVLNEAPGWQVSINVKGKVYEGETLEECLLKAGLNSFKEYEELKRPRKPATVPHPSMSMWGLWAPEEDEV